MKPVWRMALLLAGAAALSGAPLVAGLAEDLADTAKYFPAGTEGFLYFKSPGEVKGLFHGSLLIRGDRIEKHLSEAASRFASATGFDPVKNTDWVLVNLVVPSGGRFQNPLLFVHGSFNLQKLLPLLEKDPVLTSGDVTKEMVDGRPVYSYKGGNAAAFPTDQLLMLGDLEQVKASLGQKSARAGLDVAGAAQLGEAASCRILLVLGLEGLASRIPKSGANPAVAGIVSKTERLLVGLSETQLVVDLQFKEPADAKAASGMLGSVKEFGKSYFAMVQARPAMLAPDALLARISPETVYGGITAEAMTEFLAAVTITPADKLMTVRAPRDRIPFLDQGDGQIALVLGGAAIAIPTFLRGREAAAKTACMQNQRILQAGLDHYKAKTKAKQITDLGEVAEALIAEGVLPGKPDDPGEGKASFDHYALRPDGKVFCKKHGCWADEPESPFPKVLSIPGLSPILPSAPQAAPASPTETTPAGMGAAGSKGPALEPAPAGPEPSKHEKGKH